MLKKFIYFEDMITPVVVKFLYYAGLAVIGLVSLVMIIGGLASPYGAGGRVVFMGLVMLVLGPVILRVYVELVLVVFNILEELKGVNRKLAEDKDREEISGAD